MPHKNIPCLKPSALDLPAYMTGDRIGLFGGSFNPPHKGHVLVSNEVKSALGLDQIWWLLTPGNPLKDHDQLISLKERQTLCKDLIRDENIYPLIIEEDLKTQYSIETIFWLQEHLPDVHFVWIMGADNFAIFDQWKDWQIIADIIPIAVYDRPGYEEDALKSIAGKSLASYKVELDEADNFAKAAPPIWIFLTGQLSNQSSTAIRNSQNKIRNS